MSTEHSVAQPHWAEDEELRERFVLGRLDEETFQRCEAHVKSCAGCRELVDAETELIVGIRRVGREQLKQRLSRKIDSPALRESAWRSSAAIAAGMAVLLTMAVATTWLLQRQGSELAGSRPEIAEQTEIRTDRAEKTMPGSIPLPSENEFRTAAPAAQSESRLKSKGTPDTRKGTVTQRSSDQQSPPPSTPTATEVNRQRGESRSTISGAARVPGPEVTRIFGVILPPFARDRESQPQTFAQEQLGALRRAKAEEDSGQRPIETTGEKTQRLPRLILHQLLSGELGRTTGDRSAVTPIPGIWAQAERTSGTLTLTLYVDSLFADRDLLQARIDTVGTDSLIVGIAETRIGFRLPPGWLGQ